MKPKNIVVIGAGVSGLSAAWKLSELGHKVTVLERDPFVGGLCGTIEHNGYFLDFGPHGFHANNPKTAALIKKLLKGNYFTYKKNNAVKYLGRYFRYPLKPQNVLMNMNPFYALQVGLALVWAKIMLRIRKPKDRNAREWIVARFGKPMYKIFFRNYTTKVWGVGPEKLAAKFAAHRIPEISFKDLILRGLLNIGRSFSRDHKFSPQVVELYYPKDGGAGKVPEAMKELLEKNGGKVLASAEVNGINLKHKTVKSVSYLKEGKQQRIEPDVVISSMPLNLIVDLFKPMLPVEVRKASKNLNNRSLLVVNIIVRKKFVFREHSIYFTDRIFNRISDLKNYNPNMFEPGISALQAEITCEYKDKLWASKDKKIVDKVVDDCIREKFIKRSDVVESHVMRLRHAYNRYGVGFEKALATVSKEISSIDNFYSYGRQGLFRYVDVDLCIENGFEVARAVHSQVRKQSLNKFDFETLEYI